MQFKFFVIPVGSAEEAELELNHFLGCTRILTVHREFVPAGANSFWALAVEFLQGQVELSRPDHRGGKTKIDYREILSADEFALFAKLRDWRKGIAAREAVPVYTVFTNEQLAEIARKKLASINGLQSVEGIGEAKARKYGRDVMTIVNEMTNNETSGQSLPSDR